MLILLCLLVAAGAFVSLSRCIINKIQVTVHPLNTFVLKSTMKSSPATSTRPTFLKIQPSKDRTIDITINAPIPVRRYNFEMSLLESFSSTTFFKTVFVKIVLPFISVYFKKLFKPTPEETNKAEDCKLNYLSFSFIE